ncbi:MAG: ADOP family duplicated permease [Vicinamibacterales bacterium]
MRPWARALQAWRTLTGRRPDAALDDELAAYVDELTERLVSRGVPRDDARRRVLAEMGGVETVKEHVREGRAGRVLDELLRDVARAWRGLRRAPAFTAAALATLALGVAANAAIFGVAHALLIRPLPFRAPDRLVFVWADQTAEGYPRAPLSGPELMDLDERGARFEGFAGIWATTAALTGDDEPEQLRIGLVTSDFFSLLGADAALGRTFRADDETTGAPTTVLLSGAVWRRRYGGDPGIVGRRVDVNGQPAVVVGVMPEGFRLMMPPDAAVPDDLEAWLLLNRRFGEGPRGQRYLRVIGRLRPGVSEADAQADVARVGREISAAHAFYGAAGRTFEMVPLAVDAVNDVRRPLLALSAGAAILLLIACINVGALLVARAAARARETAVQRALGAGRLRVARQHLTEALLLGGLGAGLGLGLAQWGLTLILRVAPPSLGRLQLASIDGTVAAVSLATVVLWMSLLSLVPASRSAARSLTDVLGDDRSRTGGRAWNRLRGLLTLAELALSVVLVAAALLLARTVQRVQQIDPGFDAGGVLSFRVALPGPRYPTQAAFNAFSRRLQDALADLPGVTGAASISHAPYDHVPNWGGPYVATEGADPSTAPQADYRALSPGAFELLGVRLRDGRTFTETDDETTAPVVVVDERLAARTWPGAPAVGRRIAVDPAVTGEPVAWATVVGVVRHVRHRSPTEEVREQVYFPGRQARRNPSVYLVKTSGDPAAIVPAVRRLVGTLDAALPLYDIRPLQAYVDEARALRAFTARLAGLFAAAALLLAAVGVYGVVAFAVAERRRELGVRLALGAGARQVLQLVLAESAWLTAGGVALGLAGAALGAHALEAQLVGVAPWDPVSLGGAVALLVAAALGASAVPARRALGTPPAAVLRED